MILSLLSGLILAYFGWSVARLEVNVRKARAIGVPVVRIPFDLNNYVWVIAQPLVWAAIACVPIPWSSYPDFVRFSHRNWHFLEKNSPNSRFGAVWALVSPGGVHLHIADADAIQEICTRWRDFPRPTQMYRMLAVYGPSVFTVQQNDWPRHRRAVAAPFNEAIMKSVWNQSLRQTRATVHDWISRSDTGIRGMPEDMQTITLSVLAATAFPESYEFESSAHPKEHEASSEGIRDAFFIVHKYAIYLMLIPYGLMTGPLMPKKLVKIGRAAASLKNFMEKTVVEEAGALSRGEPGSGGLITHLVHALERKAIRQTGSGEDEKPVKGGLSMDEVLGNIFVINFAGQDTTSITLAFAVMLLAAHPEVQQWIREEIAVVTRGEPVDRWDYALFPRLKRCHAVFLETLRLYPPITGLPKITSETTKALRIGSRVLEIPPGTETYPMILGAQTDPRYWKDPLVWRPSRWIVGPERGIDEEVVFTPRKGSFCPWSEGPQGCAGKKFSQVEGVAVLACLFRTCSVRPKTKAGETEAQARRRAQNCADDVNYQLMLKMNHPDRVTLEYVTV
ncbi:putative cytochrome P450 [Annulohypoxylon truncatum]|uniref:putative cytochrome P450 n=1 Tax=Annulohypoxylon truncatum TaxID=327061 RepID=UPI002007944A|nr:putative cytochrome P450 [Annulohypoxylon truncatum]KAI1211127.1 putative cytochrome P450 [Annulohypoxylon truncatum]